MSILVEFFIAWSILIAVFVILFKWASIKHFFQKKKADRVLKEIPSINIRSNSFSCKNDFTELVGRTFHGSRWMVFPSFGRADYKVKNPFGDIYELNMDCELCHENKPVYRFNVSVPFVKAEKTLQFQAKIVSVTPPAHTSKKVDNLNEEYTVEFRYIEFKIPRTNPLFYDDQVRDAMGVPRAKEPMTLMEWFAELTPALPADMQEYANQIIENVRKADILAEDNADEIAETERFVEKYIPPLYDTVRFWKQQDEDDRDDAELMHMLRILASGSAKLVEKLQLNEEREPLTTKMTIEQQLFEDGLYDPTMDLIDKWK